MSAPRLATVTHRKPRRIQRRRSKGYRLPRTAVYVGRGTRYGNGWKIGEPHPDTNAPLTRAECVELYRQNVAQASPGTLAAIRDALGGRDLACWCPLDKPCHADVLLEVANAPAPEPEAAPSCSAVMVPMEAAETMNRIAYKARTDSDSITVEDAQAYQDAAATVLTCDLGDHPGHQHRAGDVEWNDDPEPEPDDETALMETALVMLDNEPEPGDDEPEHQDPEDLP